MELEQARLEEWDRWTGSDGGVRLIGRVYGHPVLPNGSPLSTTPVVEMDSELAMTADALYSLGQPCSYTEI